MSTRLRLLIALVTLAATLFPTVALAAPNTDPPDPATCRRLHGTEAWTRRCARPDHNGTDPIAYCRRVYGTEAWTDRCRYLLNEFDPVAYCRRIHGTEEWTRRCLHLNDEPFDPIAYCRRIYGTDAWTRRCLHLGAAQRPSPTPEAVRPPINEPDDAALPSEPAAPDPLPTPEPVRPAPTPRVTRP